MAIGLQAVDGLKTSDYLYETACRHIKGEITIDEVCYLISQYYAEKKLNKHHELADKVEKMADKRAIQQEMVDILTFASGRAFVTTTDVVQQFGYSATTAKRYLRQLVECGYLETHGANKNKTYSVRMDTTKK